MCSSIYNGKKPTLDSYLDRLLRAKLLQVAHHFPLLNYLTL